MKYRNWKKTFNGKSKEEIEKIISESKLSARDRYYLLEQYVRHPSPPRPPRKKRQRHSKDWASLFAGKTKEEIEQLIAKASISHSQKSSLRRKYLRNGEKLNEEEKIQIHKKCAEIGRNWHLEN